MTILLWSIIESRAPKVFIIMAYWLLSPMLSYYNGQANVSFRFYETRIAFYL